MNIEWCAIIRRPGQTGEIIRGLTDFAGAVEGAKVFGVWLKHPNSNKTLCYANDRGDMTQLWDDGRIGVERVASSSLIEFAKFAVRRWRLASLLTGEQVDTHHGIVAEYKLKDGSTQKATARIDLVTGRVEIVRGEI